MKTMYSKYPGTCKACGLDFAKGEFIKWHGRGQGVEHYSCPAKTETLYPCWDCEAPTGRLRNYGASTPVLCQPCDDKRRANDRNRYNASAEDYPCSDMGYEDQCAAACGPGL